MHATPITADFPFTSHYMSVFDAEIHYIDEGDPNAEHTFLLIHGNPTSSYLWRNIVPHLSPIGRVIALDLIGFGQSSQPDINYTFKDHIKYVNRFIKQLKLNHIILVVQDWGSAIGFNYSVVHPENVDGIVFFEAITKPYQWKDLNWWQSLLFKALRHDSIGYWMVMKKNMFVKCLLPMLAGRRLSKEELDHYRAPFLLPENRTPVWMFPREVSIGQYPSINTKIKLRYNLYHQNSDVQKLMFYTKPGLVLKYKDALNIRASWPNVSSIYLGKGGHYLQEQYPHEIGDGIVEWYGTNY